MVVGDFCILNKGNLNIPCLDSDVILTILIAHAILLACAVQTGEVIANSFSCGEFGKEKKRLFLI